MIIKQICKGLLRKYNSAPLCLLCSYLVVDRSRVGAVEFMICSHDVSTVCVPLTPHSLGRVALLT